MRADMVLADVYSSTPREVAMVVEAALQRAKDRQALYLSHAWHTAVFAAGALAGKLEPLKDVLRKAFDLGPVRQTPEEQIWLMKQWGAEYNARMGA